MMSGRYYESFRRPSPFRSSPSRPPLPSQSEAFFCHQTQQTNKSLPQQPWRTSERPLDITANGSQHHYPAQLFRQTFMPQRQQYPANDQRYHQSSLPAGANCNTALHGSQITQSAQHAPDNATNRPQAAPYQAVPRQPYQSRQSPRVYQHAEEKGVYQIDDDPAPEVDEEDGDAESFYFTNEGYEELQVNFVGIESMCDRCSTSFQSHSTFHRHIKSGCNTLVRRAMEETGSDPPFSRPVLRSTAKLSAPGSGLVFRGWSYATTSITFDPAILLAISDPDTSVCLDIGCRVSLVDKA